MGKEASAQTCHHGVPAPQSPATLLFEGGQDAGRGGTQAGRSHFSADPCHVRPPHSSQKPPSADEGRVPGHLSSAQAFLSPTCPAQPSRKCRPQPLLQLSSNTQRAHLPLSLRQILTPPHHCPGAERLTLAHLGLDDPKPSEPLSLCPQSGPAPPPPTHPLGPKHPLLPCNFRARPGLRAPFRMPDAVPPPRTPSWTPRSGRGSPWRRSLGWSPGPLLIPLPQGIPPPPSPINSTGASSSGQEGLTPRGGAGPARAPSPSLAGIRPATLRAPHGQALHFRPVMRQGAGAGGGPSPRAAVPLAS